MGKCDCNYCVILNMDVYKLSPLQHDLDHQDDIYRLNIKVKINEVGNVDK
jgi:hypothetical protein